MAKKVLILARQGYSTNGDLDYPRRERGLRLVSVYLYNFLTTTSQCLDLKLFEKISMGIILRVSARENRAEAGRRESADLHHISVGCRPYQANNHGNIYFLINDIVFENKST